MEQLAAMAEERQTLRRPKPRLRRRLEEKQQRANRIFWGQWERRFGPLPGEVDPRLYWSPGLGDRCGLRPDDMGDLTPDQLMDCVRLRIEGGLRWRGS